MNNVYICVSLDSECDIFVLNDIFFYKLFDPILTTIL